MATLLDNWQTQRKQARVLLVLDVSGSMAEIADPATGDTKLDLAKRAASQALDAFNSDDQVGLWVFSTGLGDKQNQDILKLVDTARVGDVREQLKKRIADQLPTNGTPLYTATQAAYEDAVASYDPTRINAVVLLTDGRNDDGKQEDDQAQLDKLISTLRAGSEGQLSKPVRVFTIGYGKGADLGVLRRIAESSSAAVYDSSDPKSITKVFVAVVSNF
jgi:Ca-activated chloride channel family protein